MYNSVIAAATDGGLGQLTMLVPFVAVFAIFYFLMIRPERKKQKEKEKKRKEMLENLKKGDKVQSIGGIRGTITNVKEKTVTMRVDTNTKMEFSREAISEVLDDKKGNEEADKTDPEKSKKEKDEKK